MNRWTKISLQVALPLLLLGGAIAITVLLIRNAPKPKPKERPAYRPTVEVVEAVRVTEAVPVASRGAVQPRVTAAITAGVAGPVVAVAPELVDGRAVAAGAELVAIDDVPFRAALANATANVANIERLIAEEGARAAQAEKDWRRLGEGDPDPLVLRKPQLAALAAQLEAAKAAVGRAERDLERCVIRAPFAGRVTAKTVELGQHLNPGMALARLEATDAVEVMLPVDPRELEHLELPLRGEEVADGPAVTLTAPVGDVDAVWQGRVVRTLGRLDDRTRMIRAVCRVEQPLAADPPLLPGMYVEARIAGRQRADLVRLPSSAVHQDGRLFVVDLGRKLRERQVDVVARQGDEVLVANSIENGETVLVTALPEAFDGMQVKLPKPTDADEE